MVLVPSTVVGALKSIYWTKCALLDKIVNFDTQIVKILLYRNWDDSAVFGRHLGCKKIMAATWGLYSAIFREGRQLESS